MWDNIQAVHYFFEEKRMVAHISSSLPLNKHTSLESVVKNLIKELPTDAQVTEVHIHLDGMWGFELAVRVEGQTYPVHFVPTDEKNLVGWVSLVYGQGIYESVANSVELENWP